MIKMTALVSTLFFSPLLVADNISTPYRLEDCITIALQKHQSLHVSDAQTLMAEALYQQAMSAYWPSINTTINADRADQDRTFSIKGAFALPQNLAQGLSLLNGRQPLNSLPLDMKIKMFDRDIAQASIDLTYPIFTGFKRPSIIGRAKKGIQLAQQSHRQTNLDIIRNVKKYYYGAQFALQMERLARDSVERFKILEELTEKLYHGGSLKTKKTDYLRIKTMTALTRSLLNEASFTRELAHEALGNAMGQAWDDQYQLADSEIPTAIPLELHSLIETAKNFNPKVQQLRLAIQASDYQITQARSDYYPMIGIKASAHQIWNSDRSGLINNDNQNGWNISVGMRWNLFNGFRTTEKVNQIKAQQKKLQSQQILLDQGMALQIKQQFLQIRSATKQIKNTQDAYQLSRDNRKLNTRAYQQEMVESKDVLEAQMIESYAQGAYFRSRYTLEMGLASLEYLIGSTIEQLSP